MIKNIIFDVGNVLLDYRWLDLIREYAKDEEEAQRIHTSMHDDPYGTWTKYDQGLATKEEVVAAFVRKYPGEGDGIAWLMDHPEKMCVPRPAIWDKVHQLKEKGYGIYILSNYSEDLFYEHTKDAPFMKDMDGVMVSYMVHVNKPNREIYQALCEKYQLKPEECVFFDDRKENVEGAKAYGMDAIQVVSEEQLLANMETFCAFA